MATDPNAITAQYQSLKSKGERLSSDASLTSLTREINDTTNSVTKVRDELSRARSRGYAFGAYLEEKVEKLAQYWDDARRDAQNAVSTEVAGLRVDAQQVEQQLSAAFASEAYAAKMESRLPFLEREVEDLERKVRDAETRVRSRYSTLKQDINQTAGQLHQIHWVLDQKEAASFPFLAGENVFLAAQAEWVATGKGGDDPDGILYLTDQRLLFEQKEKTGKKLGLFGGKQTQELEWELPLNVIESVQAENKGLFGGKDMLHFTLGAGAPYAKITVEVKGGVSCKFWASQVERMIRGETNDERAIAPDEELLESVRNAPTACHVCGATLPAVVAGQMQISCRYCDTIIRL